MHYIYRYTYNLWIHSNIIHFRLRWWPMDKYIFNIHPALKCIFRLPTHDKNTSSKDGNCSSASLWLCLFAMWWWVHTLLRIHESVSAEELCLLLLSSFFLYYVIKQNILAIKKYAEIRTTFIRMKTDQVQVAAIYSILYLAACSVLGPPCPPTCKCLRQGQQWQNPPRVQKKTDDKHDTE